jgi:outer membrane protein assembly factor BamA
VAQPESVPMAGQAQKITVADIRIQGSQKVSTAQVMSIIKLRVGAEYSDEAAREDVRLLYASKKFSNVEAATPKLADGNVIVY